MPMLPVELHCSLLWDCSFMGPGRASRKGATFTLQCYCRRCPAALRIGFADPPLCGRIPCRGTPEKFTCTIVTCRFPDVAAGRSEHSSNLIVTVQDRTRSVFAPIQLHPPRAPSDDATPWRISTSPPQPQINYQNQYWVRSRSLCHPDTVARIAEDVLE